VRVGSSARTPLLLANGIGASLETFRPLIAHLDRNLTVIRFDVPGIGGSPTPPPAVPVAGVGAHAWTLA
jgi:pimeloyl-ACP methyl ester carboxylesterase